MPQAKVAAAGPRPVAQGPGAASLAPLGYMQGRPPALQNVQHYSASTVPYTPQYGSTTSMQASSPMDAINAPRSYTLQSFPRGVLTSQPQTSTGIPLVRLSSGAIPPATQAGYMNQSQLNLERRPQAGILLSSQSRPSMPVAHMTIPQHPRGPQLGARPTLPVLHTGAVPFFFSSSLRIAIDSCFINF